MRSAAGIGGNDVMGRSFADRLDDREVKRLHPGDDVGPEAVKKLHHVPLAMAKADIGAAIGAAIEGKPLKHYGHEGLMSDVISGAKVPEYLARICENPESRRRLALALLKGTGVRARMVLDWDEEIA
jgi:hypothetical protein